MTLISTGIPFAWPGHAELTAALSYSTDMTISTGTYQAWIGVAREAMTISHIGFRVGAATASPKAEVRVETVDASGVPTGTLWSVNANLVSGVLTASSWNLLALTASASIAAGQVFAIVIKYNAGTSFVVQRLNGYRTSIINLPYEAPSGTKARLLGAKGVAVGSSATTFYQLANLLPMNALTSGTFDNTSSAMRGLRFQVPFACRCVGIRWWNSSSIGDFNAILLNDAGSELSSSSTAFDGDHSAANTGGVTYVYFDSPVSLATGTWYRAVLQPSAAVVITLATATLPTLDYRSAWPGGTNQHYTTYAGSWVDTATDTIPFLDILIDQVDDGTGTGSVVGVIGG